MVWNTAPKQSIKLFNISKLLEFWCYLKWAHTGGWQGC